jgi:DNA-binding Lrp family transcriptional regulator
MKLQKMLDQNSANLVTDLVNQVILRELVNQQQSISQLSEKLDIPTLKLWRRIQKLQKADLVEQTGSEKKNNLEIKLYRSTATYFAPQQFFNFKPKDTDLKAAFEIYSQIQGTMVSKTAAYNDIPKGADPTDYSLYVNMQVFADICGKPEVQSKIAELKEILNKYKGSGDYPHKHRA